MEEEYVDDNMKLIEIIE